MQLSNLYGKILCDYCKKPVIKNGCAKFERCESCGQKIIFDHSLIDFTSNPAKIFRGYFWFGGRTHDINKLSLDFFHGRPINANFLSRVLGLSLSDIAGKTIVILYPESGNFCDIFLKHSANVIAIDCNQTIHNLNLNLSIFSENLLCLRVDRTLLPIKNVSVDYIISLGKGGSTQEKNWLIAESKRCLVENGHLILLENRSILGTVYSVWQNHNLFSLLLKPETFFSIVEKTSRLWFPFYISFQNSTISIRNRVESESLFVNFGNNLWQNKQLERYNFIRFLMHKLYFSGKVKQKSDRFDSPPSMQWVKKVKFKNRKTIHFYIKNPD